MTIHRALRQDRQTRHRVIAIRLRGFARAARDRLPCGYWHGLSLTAVGISRKEGAT